MSTATDDAINAVLDRLKNVSQSGSGYTAECPAHEDRSPSLSVAEGDTQPVVFNCHAGCESEDIVGALGLEWEDICEGGDYTEQKRRFEKAPWKHGEEVAAYSYRDKDGAHVYTVKRYEHPEGWKSFRPYLRGNQRPGLGKQERLLYRLPKVREQATDGKIVFVVEGEKDVHTLEDHGFTATTTGSANSWGDRHAQHLAGACVVIIPDNDEEGQGYAESVAKSCFPVAEWVRIVELEDVPSGGGDITDWFARGHEPDELAEQIKSTDNWDPSRLSPKTNGRDDAGTDPENLSGWDRIKALYEQRNRGEARLEAARQAIDDRAFAAHRQTERLHVYDPEAHVYETGGEQALSELLVTKLGTHHSRHEQKEIATKISALTYRDSFGGPYIAVANGDLSIDPLELKDPAPKRAPLARSPATWDPSAECPRFYNHIKKVVTDDRERRTLQEYVGYCLLHWRLPFHKALFLIGPTASGKSTTLDLIRKLMAKTSSLTPQQLVNGRFGPSELDGAWANIRADISAALLKDVGLFKEIVAGDPIYVERKYEQGYTLHPKAKHLYSANRLPDVNIDDDAFYRRILLVSFPQTIPREERDPDLGEQLEAELDGVLRWAVEGLQRVLQNEGFTHDRTPEETRHRWEAHSSSIGRFKALRLNVTGNHREDFEPKKKVYSAYTAFCEEKGLSSASQRKFTRTLKGDPNIEDADRTPPGANSQISCYTGVKLPESDGAPF
jgi:putative DNA primase/helicase